jgi:hypothetical protein
LVFFTPSRLLSDNRLSLTRASGTEILIELSNSDPVAGVQFSLNARGGVVLHDVTASGRIGSAGWQVFQFLKDESTLNVVLLAPYRSSLSSGSGAIGTISVVVSSGVEGDTARVFFTGVVICDADAKTLEVGAGELAWSLRQGVDGLSACFVLEQNYPNPFSARGGSAFGGNPSTTIAYLLRRPAQVQLAVYDVAGRRVKSLVSRHQLEGRYALTWNADGDGGSTLASGMYFARLQVGDQVSIKKMVFVK